jgi:hypothetical protein
MAVLTQITLVTDCRRLVRAQVGKEEELDRTCPSYRRDWALDHRWTCRGLASSGQLVLPSRLITDLADWAGRGRCAVYHRGLWKSDTGSGDAR